MTIVELNDLGKQLIWIDGFVPNYSEFSNYIPKEVKGQSPRDIDEKDFFFFEALRDLMYSSIMQRIKAYAGESVGLCDIFFLKSDAKEVFPFKYNPVFNESKSLGTHLESYCTILSIAEETSAKYIKTALVEVLETLNYKIRMDNSYNNLDNYKQFLKELSGVALEPYVDPAEVVGLKFTEFGLQSQSGRVF